MVDKGEPTRRNSLGARMPREMRGRRIVDGSGDLLDGKRAFTKQSRGGGKAEAGEMAFGRFADERRESTVEGAARVAQVPRLGGEIDGIQATRDERGGEGAKPLIGMQRPGTIHPTTLTGNGKRSLRGMSASESHSISSIRCSTKSRMEA